MADINSNLPVSDTADGATGAAVPTNAIQVGGTDGTNLRAISTDSTGKVNINNVSGTVSLPTNAAQETGGHLASIDGKLADNYGSSTVGVRTSSQIGNTAGAADFNYGTVGAQTLRTASEIGNATGAADFNASTTGAQTLRTSSNITRNGTELSYNTGSTDANTLRVAANLANAAGAIDYNYGTVGAQTIRTASEIGNATGAADFNNGASGVQTLRTAANIADGAGTKLTSQLIGAAQSLNTVAQGNVASAATDSGNPVKVGGIFNTTLPTFTNGQRGDAQLDLNGRLLVANSPLDGYKTSYSTATLGLVAAATPTDIFTITGSATKTIRITYISVSATQNTSAARDVLLLKRSTANTGGTSTAQTAVPHDSNNAAATGTILAYTANPTLGTLVGSIRTRRLQLLATNVTNPNDTITWEFGDRPAQAIVLRGTSQVLAINLNSVTSSNNLFDISIEWTEE